MYTVYLLCSETFPEQKYIGFTENLQKRLKAHNAGQSNHTARYKPWSIVLSVDFPDKKRRLLLLKRILNLVPVAHSPINTFGDLSYPTKRKCKRQFLSFPRNSTKKMVAC